MQFRYNSQKDSLVVSSNGQWFMTALMDHPKGQGGIIELILLHDPRRVRGMYRKGMIVRHYRYASPLYSLLQCNVQAPRIKLQDHGKIYRCFCSCRTPISPLNPTPPSSASKSGHLLDTLTICYNMKISSRPKLTMIKSTSTYHCHGTIRRSCTRRSSSSQDLYI